MATIETPATDAIMYARMRSIRLPGTAVSFATGQG